MSAAPGRNIEELCDYVFNSSLEETLRYEGNRHKRHSLPRIEPVQCLQKRTFRENRQSLSYEDGTQSDHALDVERQTALVTLPGRDGDVALSDPPAAEIDESVSHSGQKGYVEFVKTKFEKRLSAHYYSTAHGSGDEYHSQEIRDEMDDLGEQELVTTRSMLFRNDTEQEDENISLSSESMDEEINSDSNASGTTEVDIDLSHRMQPFVVEIERPPQPVVPTVASVEAMGPSAFVFWSRPHFVFCCLWSRQFWDSCAIMVRYRHDWGHIIPFFHSLTHLLCECFFSVFVQLDIAWRYIVYSELQNIGAAYVPLAHPSFQSKINPKNIFLTTAGSSNAG